MDLKRHEIIKVEYGRRKRVFDYVIDENGEEILEYKVKNTIRSIPLKDVILQIQRIKKNEK
ncbi:MULTISPECIES: hypothetical protein [Helcococcus]|uniref:Uncharacterized protein n=1 Tax=Helcococcus bovis TaxID=3153252 RepID=A0ABW9F6V9_9FIRM